MEVGPGAFIGREVSCALVQLLLGACEHRGLKREAVIQALPYPPQHLEDPRQRISWDAFCQVLEHVGSLYSDAELIRVGRLAPRTAVARRRVRLARHLLELVDAYRFVVGRPSQDPLVPLMAAVREVDPTHLELTLSLRPGYRYPPKLFLLIQGAVESLPGVLGYPACRFTVTATWRGVLLHIEHPPPGGLRRRTRRARLFLGKLFLLPRYEQALSELFHRTQDLEHEVDQRRDAEERLRSSESDLERQVAVRTAELERANAGLRELQQALLQAQRAGAARDVAGAVAHAINNPLTSLRGRIELLAAGERVSEQERTRLVRLAERIQATVADIRSLVRPQPIQVTRLPLAQLLRDVRDEIEPRARAAGIPLDVDVEPELTELWADGPRLVTALVAIAENGLEAMRPGGRLVLRVESAPPSVVRFVVQDNGPGIPDELRARVLDPFFSTKPAGTGLGLAIAEGIVRGHNGRIRFEDAPGGGARTVVEIGDAASDGGGV